MNKNCLWNNNLKYKHIEIVFHPPVKMNQIVTTDMTSIRDHRDVHKTMEFNAFIEMSQEKQAQRENNNRKGDAGLENNRSFNKKVETKKDKEIEKEKEKVKEFKATQEKLLSPTPPSAGIEVEETFQDTEVYIFLMWIATFGEGAFLNKKQRYIV